MWWIRHLPYTVDQRNLFLRLLVAGIVLLAGSCREGESPTVSSTPLYETAWPPGVDGLLEWGNVGDSIFASSGKEGSYLLTVWKWKGDVLVESVSAPVPKCIQVVPASQGLCVMALDPGDNYSDWPYCVFDFKEGKVIEKWPTPGWYIKLAAANSNGSLIALVATEDVSSPPPGYDFEVSSAKVGILDVSKKELRWRGLVSGPFGEDACLTSVAVTDDGRYIAVAGWSNGVAMVDCEAGKVLWSIRPREELSSGYAVFSPDSKVVYAAGSEGCVYGMDVTTGTVLSARYATRSGKYEELNRIEAVAISKDGEWLAAGVCPDGEVYLWNLKDSSRPRIFLHNPPGVMGTVLILSFSPDARRLASVGKGGLKIWQVKD